MILLLAFSCLLLIADATWVKEMENAGMFEGDISYRTEDHSFGSIRGGRWPHARVPYQIEKTASHAKDVIMKAISEYHKYTCLRFFPKRSTDKEYLSFFNGGGCFSPVGFRRWRYNRVSIAGGCTRLGTVEHEMAHSLGMLHEQSRPDRDRYVNIRFENISPKKAFNFEKSRSIDSLGSPYDVSSIMHYGSYAFSNNGKMTIETVDPADQIKIGQRNGFSRTDVKQINKMYCSGRGPTALPPTTVFICRDKSNNCSYFNSQGYCKGKYAAYMQKNCAKTCKLC